MYITGVNLIYLSAFLIYLTGFIALARRRCLYIELGLILNPLARRRCLPVSIYMGLGLTLTLYP